MEGRGSRATQLMVQQLPRAMASVIINHNLRTMYYESTPDVRGGILLDSSIVTYKLLLSKGTATRWEGTVMADTAMAWVHTWMLPEGRGV